MWARGRSESGFTTIELLLAMLIGSVGVISLIGTFDVSRRVTSYSEMKEAAAHVAEQKMEELRALDYGELALNGSPSPGSSSDPKNPAYYVSGTSYRWNQKSDAPTGHTEPLVIDATDGEVAAAAESWSDGRLHGKVYRYVTCAAAAADDCDQGGDTSGYKRVTVAVTVENSLGPQKPILVQTVVSDPNLAHGEGANPGESPDTFCTDPDTGATVECSEAATGTVSTWYLYDTPATSSTRQEITGSHSTHATIAPSGTCTAGDTSGCPVPDLMGIDPPPAPGVTPPVYNYSSEITGGTTPGGAVVRRDTTCTGGTPTTTDNTKGHMWVTPPLAADMAVSDAALSLSTLTFNGVTADALLCIAFYDVPGSLTNLVATPPTLLVSKGAPQSGLMDWPRTAKSEAFVLELFEAGSATIPAGHRFGMRIWASSSSQADLVALYDHPLHVSYLQVSG